MSNFIRLLHFQVQSSQPIVIKFSMEGLSLWEGYRSFTPKNYIDSTGVRQTNSFCSHRQQLINYYCESSWRCLDLWIWTSDTNIVYGTRLWVLLTFINVILAITDRTTITITFFFDCITPVYVAKVNGVWPVFLAMCASACRFNFDPIKKKFGDSELLCTWPEER